MKKTRNLFILRGNETEVKRVLDDLDFKGLITVYGEEPNIEERIRTAFSKNKSIVCSQSCITPSVNTFNPIFIQVCSGTELIYTARSIINIDEGEIYKQFQEIANKFDCDIGEYNSISTVEECVYCNLLRGFPVAPGYQYIIYSSTHFFVTPAIGQFIEGYLLIIPYSTVNSIAELSNSLLSELYEVLKEVKCILKLVFGQGCNFLVWESTGEKSTNSVSHAHIHVAPSILNPKDIKKKSGFDFQDISLEDLSEYQKKSYFLLQEIANNWIINADPEFYIPCQYIQQLIAESVGLTSASKNWNRRSYSYNELMRSTTEKFLSAVNYHSLSGSIKSRANLDILKLLK